jgi:hypothetical protein
VGRILLSIVLGLFAPVVAFMAAAMVEVPGQNPIQEPVAGGIAVAIYLAICQFLVTPRGKRTLSANWPTMVAMGAPLVAVCLIALAKGRGFRGLLHDALPPIAAGCIGIVAGAWAAGRVALSALSLESCRRNLRASATLLAAVAVVLAAAVIPLTRKAGTFPDGAPGGMVSVCWGIVGLGVLIAATLALIANRAGRGRRPPFFVLGFLGFLAFVPAGFLAIPAIWFLGHGPVMRAVSILSPMCSAAELVVAALVGATAVRLPGQERA